MKTYLIRLAYSVLGAFFATLAGQAGAAAFDVLTFAWSQALTTSASAAVLVLLHGLAARFQGDAGKPWFGR